MKTINVSEATKNQLNWLVAIALGAQQVKTPESQSWMLHWPSPLFGDQPRWSKGAQGYTTDWSLMGPIIEREHISLTSPTQTCCWPWTATKGPVREFGGGPNRSPLIAAARCYIVSKLGQMVEVPEELP